MTRHPKVSIIIPVIAVNDYVRESVPKILNLDWPDFEIIIFPDEPDSKNSWPKTKLIASGKIGPAGKRNLALKYASGEIVAFLDDDAYPEKDWLKQAIGYFSDPKVAAVGGPAITPADDGVLQKVSGAVYESYIGGAGVRNRYLSVGETREVDDWPTVNLLVRKDIFEKVGGFDCSFWPGEDTKLCLDIIHQGSKIVYGPKVIAYHHRRSNLLKHFKQIGGYGLHRGHFARIFPETSFRLLYFIPSLFDLYLIALIAASLILSSKILFITLIPLLLYFSALIVDSFVISWRWRNPLVGLITIPMIFLTHVWYGIRFVIGYGTKKLVSKLATAEEREINKK